MSRDDRGRSVLSVAGDVDIAVADHLRAAAVDEIAAEGHTGLVIDLAGVTFMDSTGLGALVSIRNAAGTGPDALELTNPSPRVAQVLTLTHLDQAFTIRQAD